MSFVSNCCVRDKECHAFNSPIYLLGSRALSEDSVLVLARRLLKLAECVMERSQSHDTRVLPFSDFFQNLLITCGGCVNVVKKPLKVVMAKRNGRWLCTMHVHWITSLFLFLVKFVSPLDLNDNLTLPGAKHISRSEILIVCCVLPPKKTVYVRYK